MIFCDQIAKLAPNPRLERSAEAAAHRIPVMRSAAVREDADQ